MFHELAQGLGARGFGAVQALRDFRFDHLGPDLGKERAREPFAGLESVLPEQGHGGVAWCEDDIVPAVAKSQGAAVLGVRGISLGSVANHRAKDQHVAGLHVPTQKRFEVALLAKVRGGWQIAIHHIGVIVRGDRLVALLPTMRSPDKFQATRSAAHGVEGDPERNDLATRDRPEGNVLMPRRFYGAARALHEELLIEEVDSPAVEDLVGEAGQRGEESEVAESIVLLPNEDISVKPLFGQIEGAGPEHAALADDLFDGRSHMVNRLGVEKSTRADCAVFLVGAEFFFAQHSCGFSSLGNFAFALLFHDFLAGC